MIRSALILFLVCATGRAAEFFPDVELAGIVDLGTVRLACLKADSKSGCMVLHLGESRAGFTLRAIDANEGWVVVESGNIQRKLFAVTRSTTSMPPIMNGASPAPGLRPPAWSGGPGTAVRPRVAGASVSIQSPTAFPEEVSSGRELPNTPAGFSSANSLPGMAGEEITVPVPSTGERQVVTSPLEGDSTGGDGAGPGLLNPEDAITREGEKIRKYYGDQAFAAWQKAQYKKSLQP